MKFRLGMWLIIVWFAGVWAVYKTTGVDLTRWDPWAMAAAFLLEGGVTWWRRKVLVSGFQPD